MTAAAAEQPDNPHSRQPEEPLFMEELGLALDKSPYQESIQNLSASRDLYFDACKLFSVKPSEVNFDLVEKAAQPYAYAFTSSLTTLAEGVDLIQYQAGIKDLFEAEQERKRVTLNVFLKKEVLPPSTEPFPITIIDKAAAGEAMFEDIETVDELKKIMRNTVAVLFAESVEDDTNTFSEAVSTGKAAKLLNFRTEVGRHALDMAKYTASAVIGMLIVNKFKRK